MRNTSLASKIRSTLNKRCRRWSSCLGLRVGVGQIGAAGLQAHGGPQCLTAVGFETGLQALHASAQVLAPLAGCLRLQGLHSSMTGLERGIRLGVSSIYIYENSRFTLCASLTFAGQSMRKQICQFLGTCGIGMGRNMLGWSGYRNNPHRVMWENIYLGLGFMCLHLQALHQVRLTVH